MSIQSLCLAALMLASSVVSQTGLNDNNPPSTNCSCYGVTSGNSQQYFSYHLFYDFRYYGRANNDYRSAPPIITSANGNEMTRDQDVLNSTSWNNDWGIMNWGKSATADAPTAMKNSPANVYLVQTNNTDLNNPDPTAMTYLTLRTTRQSSFQSTAEIENEQKNLMYCSVRFLARIRGSGGAVAGLFTYADENNESDIEILTSDDKGTYRFTNQPSVDKNGNSIDKSSIISTGLSSWNDWHVMRIDWVKGTSRWYIDGRQVAENSYSVPKKPSGLILNMWGDGGVWSGNMTVGGQAELHVQWVEVVFNTSGKRDGQGSSRGNKAKRSWSFPASKDVDSGRNSHLQRRKSSGCERVCVIDGVQNDGFPEVVKGMVSRAAGKRNTLSWILTASAFILLLIITAI